MIERSFQIDAEVTKRRDGEESIHGPLQSLTALKKNVTPRVTASILVTARVLPPHDNQPFSLISHLLLAHRAEVKLGDLK